MSAAATVASVVVWGSANADVVLTVERTPQPGETVLARSQTRHAGGKGLNQAVAAARAGATTILCAALGSDSDGQDLRSVADHEGIDTSNARQVEAPTGTAHVHVQDDGDNCIVVSAGANAHLDEPTAAEQAVIAAAGVLVLSLEVPLSGVEKAIATAGRARPSTTVVLNAAPALVLPTALLADVDVLVVNEHEAALLAGDAVANGGSGAEDAVTASRAAAVALARSARAVVVTLGGDGALVATRARGVSPDGPALVERVPAPRVQVVDTTAAGDTFTGYLAASLAAGAGLLPAVRRAVAAGALAVQRPGAVPSIPRAQEVPTWGAHPDGPCGGTSHRTAEGEDRGDERRRPHP